MHGFWKQKIDFLTLDKIFVLDNLNIVLDKNILSGQHYLQLRGKVMLPNGIFTPSDCGKNCFEKQEDYVFEILSTTASTNFILK